MRKAMLIAALLASLVTAAAQQPAEGERGHMRMNGMMMEKCPMTAMMGSADVTYEATETGARLVFTAKDPNQVTEIQAMVREMAEKMNKREGMMLRMRGMKENTETEGNHDIHHPAK